MSRQMVAVAFFASEAFVLIVQYAQVAQLVEQWTENPRVGGSNPPLGTIYSPNRIDTKRGVAQTAHHAFPLALTGHKSTTDPSRTQTYQSCRLQVGSQCPGTRHNLSLIFNLFCLSSMIPCSSEQVTYEISSRPKITGRPLSTDWTFSPASQTA